MLGVVCSRKKIQHFYSVVIIDCGILIFMKVMAKYLNVELRNMQSLKFPPSIIYVAYSLVIIVLALYAKRKNMQYTLQKWGKYFKKLKDEG